MNIKKLAFKSILLGLLLLAAGFALGNSSGEAYAQTSPLHPTFPLLDEDGGNVLETGNPISTMATCGACHDTAFIESHSFHADVGLSVFGQPTSSRPWDGSTGLYGKWNPLTYRYLTPEGDDLVDLTLADWIMTQTRHVGGGPADVPLNGFNFEDGILDPETGEVVPWDWEASGTVEMNCFLCHTTDPNNLARLNALQNGEFQWSSTATLIGSGIVNDDRTYNEDAFNKEGELASQYVNIQDPSNENCGQCHGLVHDDLIEPVLTVSCRPDANTTVTTGQIVSPQKMADSGMNLENKSALSRSWDVHAERLVQCTDCHFSLNNPVYYEENGDSRPDHLTFDPRRLELGEYLEKPIHDFARGQSAQGTIAPELKDTMRRCESCHDAGVSHDFLPYADRHFETVSCETCHIPKLYAPAIQQYDWTVLQLSAEPASDCRGYENNDQTLNSLVTGYEPVLLSREDVDGENALAPYNMVTSWFWVHGENENTRPVRMLDLEAAWLDGGQYPAEIMGVFDQNQDGELDHFELAIDSPTKESLIQRRLETLGLKNVRIEGEVQPYSINHDVAEGEWAIRECQSCHGADSRVTQPILLADYVPGGVLPKFVQDSNTALDGKMTIDDEGALYYAPRSEDDDLYVLGQDNVSWVDWAGVIFFIGTIGGISTHGGMRYFAAKKRVKHAPKIEKVYMYTVYERLWHWLQTFAILVLLVTGLIIHKPEMLGMFSFRHAVLVHNVLAAVLVINALLSLFYHLVSGEIKQYIPRPRGFFDQAITQTMFYLKGIFRGDEHPFEKTPQKKMNPLQQVTYFGILNVLLPLQIITGALMWGVQRLPEIAERLGGLPFLAPFHTLVAWSFATFIVAHVYLTTTGHEPTAAIKAMMLGWDEVEVHTHEEEAGDLPLPEEATA